jgi:hypothetical protein
MNYTSLVLYDVPKHKHKFPLNNLTKLTSTYRRNKHKLLVITGKKGKNKENKKLNTPIISYIQIQ